MARLNKRDILKFSTMGFLTAGFGIGCEKRKIKNGILRVALAGAPDSLNPMKAEFAISALLFRQFMLPVVGYGDNAMPVPAIAQSWEAKNNFKTWVFTIKSGLVWSDGVQLGAKDIVDSLKYAADWRNTYPDAAELFLIKGFRDKALNQADAAEIGVKQIGSDKVEIQLEGNDANFPAKLQEFYPIPMHALEKNGDKFFDIDKIVVSGAYIPVEYSQTRLRFIRNPKYALNNNSPNEINIEAVDDGVTRVRMFESNDVDLAQDPPLSRYQILQKKHASHFKRSKSPRFYYMSFNTKRPQFSDKIVRQALNLAINRDIIAHNIFKDAVVPATRFIRSQAQLASDKAKARDMLMSRGINANSPLMFEILTTKDERERAALQIIDMLKDVGVIAVVNTADSSSISTRLNGFDFDASIVKIDKGMKADPIDLMASFANGGNAYSHNWKNSEFDKALDFARGQGNDKARLDAIIKAESFLLEEVPVLPLWFQDSAWLFGERVVGGLKDVPPIIWPQVSIKD